MNHVPIRPVSDEELSAAMNDDMAWLDGYEHPDDYATQNPSEVRDSGVDTVANELIDDADSLNEERRFIVDYFGDEQSQLFMQFYCDGLTVNDLLSSDDSYAEQYQRFVAALDTFLPVTKTQLTERAKLYVELERVAERLKETAPQILEGKLPLEQEALLGSERYAIGFNQTGTYSLEESAALVKEYGGIPLYEYPLAGRFNVVNNYTAPSMIEPLATSGYAGTHLVQRFVIAVPMDKYTGTEKELSGIEVNSATMNEELPDDFIDESTDNNSVSPKYIAGVITKTGEYVPNLNFAKSSEFKLPGVTDEAVRRAIGARMLEEAEPL